MFKGVLFDLDGTLVNSFSLLYEATGFALTQIPGLKCTEEQIALIALGDVTLFEKLVGKKFRDKVLSTVARCTEDQRSRVKPHDGVFDMLNLFKQAGVPMSTVTDRSRRSTELILENNKLTEYFVSVVTITESGSQKPSPLGLLRALEKMKLDPTGAFYVGDRTVDINAAHAAGMQGIAATWDKSSKSSDLEEQYPDFWAKSPTDVFNYWRRFAMPQASGE